MASFKQRPSFSQGPNWQDITDALHAVREEIGLHASLRMTPIGDDGLHVEVFIWNEVNDVKMGVARSERVYPHQQHKTIEGCVIWCIHRAFNEAYDRAFAPLTSQGRRAK